MKRVPEAPGRIVDVELAFRPKPKTDQAKKKIAKAGKALAMRYALLIAALLFCQLAFAASDNSQKSASVQVSQQIKKSEDKSEKPQSGTEDFPFFVKGNITTERTKTEADKEAADSKEKTALEESRACTHLF